MKILGVLLILNSLVLAGWWVANYEPNRAVVVALSTLAVFAGAFLILQDRVLELSVDGIGKIKTAAQEATENLREIQKLRERVEAQSATVDLVAQSASEAQKIATQAKHTVSLANLVLAAQNDHRPSFDELRRVAATNSSSTAFINKVLAEVAQSVNPLVVVRLDAKPSAEAIGFDPEAESWEQWSAVYPRLHSLHRPHALSKIWVSSAPLGQKLEFLAKVIHSDESLRALHRACILMNKEASVNKNILAYEAYQQWWRENREKYTGGK